MTSTCSPALILASSSGCFLNLFTVFHLLHYGSFGGLGAKPCLDCLNWTVLALTSGKFCPLLWVVPMCWSAQYSTLCFHTPECLWGLLNLCQTLCFLESTCQNRFLSPAVGCRMVVSDQRSQPTVGVQTPRRQRCRGGAHTQKVPVQVVQICLRSLGNDDLAGPVYFTVSRRASEVKTKLKKQANVKDPVPSASQMSVCLPLWAQFL